MARPAQDLGDGPPCPEPGADHKLIVLKPSNRLWCGETQAIYADATYSEEARGFVAGPQIRSGDRIHGDTGSLAVGSPTQELHGAA